MCCEDEPIYIVTELMPGGSLLALLRTQHKGKNDLSVDVLIDMAAQVMCCNIPVKVNCLKSRRYHTWVVRPQNPVKITT